MSSRISTPRQFGRPKAPVHKRRGNRLAAPKYLRLIRTLTCCLSGQDGVEAAHVRYADHLHSKTESGMGRKPDDKWVLPLHPNLHRLHVLAQHNSCEREWWARFHYDPLNTCERLWEWYERDPRPEVMIAEVLCWLQPRDRLIVQHIDMIVRSQ